MVESTSTRKQPEGGHETPSLPEGKSQKGEDCGGCGLLTPEETKQRIAEGRSLMLTHEEVMQKFAQGGSYLRGSRPKLEHEFPKTLDEDRLPDGAPPERLAEFYPIWIRYIRLPQLTNGFELDTFPGACDVVGLVPFPEYFDSTSREAKLVVELAQLAIQEYNEKECNVFKYEVLKIEKANFLYSGYDEFFMTVKVRNLTVGTLIETFQIHAAVSAGTRDKVVFYCRPKEEKAVVGFAKLAGEGSVTEGKAKGT